MRIRIVVLGASGNAGSRIAALLLRGCPPTTNPTTLVARRALARPHRRDPGLERMSGACDTRPVTAFDATDSRHRIGRYLVRRARPEDAAEFSRADAEFVSAAYAGVMPPEFAEHQRADIPAATVRNEAQFARDLSAEEEGAEPEHRTWIALDEGRITGISITSTVPQEWEPAIGATPIPGLSRQLDHLYLDRSAWGTGLASGLLDLALPGRLDAYLWIVAGNDRAWRFYERHGFRGDGRAYECGPLWYDRVLYRMVRREHPA